MEAEKLNKEEGSERNILLWMLIIICLCIASSMVLESNKTEKAIEKLDIVQKGLSRLDESLDRTVNRLGESYRIMGNGIGDRIEEHLDRIENRLDDSSDRVGKRTVKRINESLDRIERDLSLLSRKLNEIKRKR
ncbi:MAG: hypothetical protein ABIE75_01280 [Candidatus Omnitrophota bacterium]